MNQEDMLRILQQQMGYRQQTITIPVEKIDAFIDACIEQKEETLYSLGQALLWWTQQAPMISIPQAQVYPLCIQRIQQRLAQGET